MKETSGVQSGSRSARGRTAATSGTFSDAGCGAHEWIAILHKLCGMVIFLRERGEFSAALCVVAVAASADFSTGRALSAFYAQTGWASWLGIAASGVAFGVYAAMLSHLARRTGAANMPELLRRMPGGRMGKGACVLYALLVALAICALAAAAGRAGALALPMRHAFVLSAALSLALAMALVLSGSRALKGVCFSFVALLALFETALMRLAQSPSGALNYELELKLRGNLLAALGLALLHASACACVSAGVALRLGGGRMRPGRMGLFSGGLFALLLLAGNAALLLQPEQVLALRLPFVALASAWGHAGFYLSAGLSYLASVTGMAGLLCGFLPRKMMLNYEFGAAFG